MAAAILLAAGRLAAAPQTTLIWNLKELDRFFLDEVVTIKNSLTLQGKEYKEEASSRRVLAYSVTKADGRSLTLEQRVVHWRWKTAAQPEADLFERLLKDVPLRFTITSDGGVRGTAENRERLREIVKHVKNDDERKAATLTLTEDSFLTPLQWAFGLLPHDTIRKGDKWRRNLKLPEGPFGSLACQLDLVADGAGDEGEVVGIAVKLKHAVGDDGGAFRMVKSDLKGDGKGKLIFDAAAGRLIRLELHLPLAGTLTVEAAGKQDALTLAGEESRTLRVTLENPFKEKDRPVPRPRLEGIK